MLALEYLKALNIDVYAPKQIEQIEQIEQTQQTQAQINIDPTQSTNAIHINTIASNTTSDIQHQSINVTKHHLSYAQNEHHADLIELQNKIQTYLSAHANTRIKPAYLAADASHTSTSLIQYIAQWLQEAYVSTTTTKIAITATTITTTTDTTEVFYAALKKHIWQLMRERLDILP